MPQIFKIIPVFVLILFLAASKSVTARQVSISFNVDMAYQVNQGNFDPKHNFVDLAGSFNGWGATQILLSDDDNDYIYSAVVGGFTPGNTIEFKFRIDGVWDGREEFPGGGPNRTYTVQTGGNEIIVYYNDELPLTGPPLARFSASATAVFENSTVWFRNQSGGEVSDWEWWFEGGKPSISSEKEPFVSYEQSGSFDVTLIARHENLADTLTFNNYIKVRPRDMVNNNWWNSRVFYEIFVRSFYDSSGDGIGDFRGLTQRLDYLNDGNPDTPDDLGITGIWLMPIHESPSYHGYDVADYRSVNRDFGTMDDFRDFLRAAHDRGIAVIIDFVLNHSSSEHPWFQKSAQNDPAYRNFYRWRSNHPGYNGPWGQNVWHLRNNSYYYGLFWSGMPDINFRHQPVKDSLFAAADFWLRDIGIDGFRLDAVKYIYEDEEGPSLQNLPETYDFFNQFTQQVRASNPNAFTVGEAWTSTEQVIPYVIDNRIDFAFEFDLSFAIMNAVQSGIATRLIDQMQMVYTMYPYQQFATFLTNHDQVRVMSQLNDIGKAKAAATIYLTLPGVPFIYYGEEIGMRGNKPDPDIRTPMQWTAGNQAGFTTGSPWRAVNPDYTTVNVAAQQADENSLWNLYRSLISARNNFSALQTGSYQLASASSNSIYSFTRSHENETILVVINTSPQSISSAEIVIPGTRFESGDYYLSEILSGSERKFSFTSSNSIGNLSLAPYESMIIVLEDNFDTSIDYADQPIRDFRLDQNFPNPFNPETTFRYHLSKPADVSITVYNVMGQRVWISDRGIMPAGRHDVSFSASGLSSGIYLYRLVVDGRPVDTRKMLLLK
jgi:alpha-amylase